MAVTKRQKQVLDFVAHFVEDNGYSPSYEEIARGLNLASLATVHKHITTLETKQYLKRGFNQSRSLDLGPKYIQEQRKHRQETSLEIPLLGRIAAGAPVEAIEQREAVRFGDFLGNPDVFALEVRGESMIGDHICDGDLIVVQSQKTAENGQTVAVWLRAEQEATLKRFYLEDGRVRLQPANTTMQPIYTDPENVEIKGHVVGVIRRIE